MASDADDPGCRRLAVESLVFVGVHAKYREVTPIAMSAVLGLLMAFLAYGRMVLRPF